MRLLVESSYFTKVQNACIPHCTRWFWSILPLSSVCASRKARESLSLCFYLKLWISIMSFVIAPTVDWQQSTQPTLRARSDLSVPMCGTDKGFVTCWCAFHYGRPFILTKKQTCSILSYAAHHNEKLSVMVHCKACPWELHCLSMLGCHSKWPAPQKTNVRIVSCANTFATTTHWISKGAFESQRKPALKNDGDRKPMTFFFYYSLMPIVLLSCWSKVFSISISESRSRYVDQESRLQVLIYFLVRYSQRIKLKCY